MTDLKDKIKILTVLVAVLAIAAVAVIFYQFKRSQGSQLIPIPDSAANALLSLARVHQTATHNGRIQWELDAESAQLEKGSNDLVLQAPRIVFFPEDGSRIELTASRGVLNTKNNNLTVDGAVRLFSNHYAMHTEKLSYQHNRRMLKSDGIVKIYSKAIELQANTMTYNIETNRARFRGQVEGKILERIDL